MTNTETRARPTCKACLNSRDANARLIEDAKDWLLYVMATRLLPLELVVRKAMQALVLSIREDLPDCTGGLAVPSKLVGVLDHQEAVRMLHADAPPPFAWLDLEEHQGRLAASYGGMLIGYVQNKHAWLRPLVEHGATLHLLKVTGNVEGHTRGVNVAFGSLSKAIQSYKNAQVA